MFSFKLKEIFDWVCSSQDRLPLPLAPRTAISTLFSTENLSLVLIWLITTMYLSFFFSVKSWAILFVYWYIGVPFYQLSCIPGEQKCLFQLEWSCHCRYSFIFSFSFFIWTLYRLSNLYDGALGLLILISKNVTSWQLNIPVSERNICCYILSASCYILSISCYILSISCHILLLHPFNLLLHPFQLFVNPVHLLLHPFNLLLHPFNLFLHRLISCYILPSSCYIPSISWYILSISRYILSTSC